MNTKTKSELVADLATRFPLLSQPDAKAAVDTILGAITKTLGAGGRVEIRGFGSFTLNYRSPRVGRNPMTGETVQVSGKHAPHFKAGKELRAGVDRRS